MFKSAIAACVLFFVLIPQSKADIFYRGDFPGIFYQPTHVHARIRHHTRHRCRHPEPVQTVSFGQSVLVDRARQYLGQNPTGWAHVWCGRFLAMIAPEAAKRVGNPNFAKNWARLPHVEARIGAIAVLGRRGGGHVGIIMSVDANTITLISGNHGHRVAIGKYARNRVIAYVDAGV